MAPENHRAIIDEATLLLAEAGVRGATLRKIGARSGVNFASLALRYGGKPRLIAACFADVVERDLARLTALAGEHDAVGGRHLGSFLWSLCEDAGGTRRTDHLVITELLLGSDRPELAATFCGWIVRRRSILRTMAHRAAVDPLVLDIIGLILLMECCFAVSNYDSINYRLIARAGFSEALARLTDGDVPPQDEDLRSLAAEYFISPRETTATPPSGEVPAGGQGKAQIIEAAAALFEEQGVDRLTNRAVAKRAGVSLALTTYHFESINELILAGLRRAVENVAASLEPGAAQDETRRALLADRRRPAQAREFDVRIHRGMLHISLIAARSPREAHLGHLMRRQIGLLAHVAVVSDKGDGGVPRTSATAYALWSAAAYLVARPFPPDEQPYDFEAQADLTSRCLLGFD